jgi:hypothetical protein
MQPRLLVLGTAAAIVAVYASFVVGARLASDREVAADARYTDARALIEAPLVSIDELKAERDTARADLEQLQASLAPATIDPASDEPTALLAQRAAGAGLNIISIERIEPRQADVSGATYTVHAVRINVSGGRDQVAGYLLGLHEEQPALVATLTALSAEGDAITAELVFSVHVANVADTPEEAP